MEFKHCNTFWSQVLGLMFKRKTIPYLFTLPIEQRIGLHTFFVFYPIHVYFFDSGKKLVEKTVMKPFTMYTSKKNVKYVLESNYRLDNMKF